jgi:hypothetical protein
VAQSYRQFRYSSCFASFSRSSEEHPIHHSAKLKKQGENDRFRENLTGGKHVAILSQRGYALHRGVALSAVQKAIATHRISIEPDGRIDSEKADVEWRQNTLHRQPPISDRIWDEDDRLGFDGSQYRRARAVREQYQARLAKLEYEERKGMLLRKDDVEMATFNMARIVRDRMLNIPDRVAAMMAAETDAARCYEILDSEIREALNGLADSIDKESNQRSV